MSTRTDEDITPDLSVRYDLHGDCAHDRGPLQLRFERTENLNGWSTSLLVQVELTEHELDRLIEHATHARDRWREARAQTRRPKRAP